MEHATRHPDEPELLDHYYGDEDAAVEGHVRRCARCAEAYSAWAATLDRLAAWDRRAVEPDPDAPFWAAQRAAILARLTAAPTRREPATRWTRRLAGPARRPRLGLAAALGAAAALLLLTWAPWRAPTPPTAVPEQNGAPRSVAQLDEADDRLLREIDALLTGPLGSLGDGRGWPGTVVPTL